MVCHPRERGAVSEEGGFLFPRARVVPDPQPHSSISVTGTAGKEAFGCATWYIRNSLVLGQPEGSGV